MGGMNRLTGRIGAAVVTVTVALFALCMIVGYTFGSYLVCMFLPIGYVMTAAGFFCECREDRRAAAVTGLIFAAVYAVLILLVYYAQTTSVRRRKRSRTRTGELWKKSCAAAEARCISLAAG